ncbi:hypothetical protein JTB14_014560 [Gonioctena quinquepunctata]|nr:hypothetical protein JTB14_014560 [Gonioctena quinquepunctata]
MSSNNANKTRSRSTQGFLGLLSRVSKSELKQIRVAVKRNNITATGPPGPIERSIDDPKLIVPNFSICIRIRGKVLEEDDFRMKSRQINW